MYAVKTYHHSSSVANGGAIFVLQYEGNPARTLRQAASGQNPAMIMMPTDMVLSSADGIIRLELNKQPHTETKNPQMNLNAMEIFNMNSA